MKSTLQSKLIEQIVLAQDQLNCPSSDQVLGSMAKIQVYSEALRFLKKGNSYDCLLDHLIRQFYFAANSNNIVDLPLCREFSTKLMDATATCIADSSDTL